MLRRRHRPFHAELVGSTVPYLAECLGEGLTDERRAGVIRQIISFSSFYRSRSRYWPPQETSPSGQFS